MALWLPLLPGVVVRISRKLGTGGTVVEVDGRLQSADVDELTREFAAADGPIVVELSNLQSADDAGVEALRKLASAGVRFQGASEYIALLLKKE